jgi:hypothetical protein
MVAKSTHTSSSRPNSPSHTLQYHEPATKPHTPISPDTTPERAVARLNAAKSNYHIPQVHKRESGDQSIRTFPHLSQGWTERWEGGEKLPTPVLVHYRSVTGTTSMTDRTSAREQASAMASASASNSMWCRTGQEGQLCRSSGAGASMLPPQAVMKKVSESTSKALRPARVSTSFPSFLTLGTPSLKTRRQAQAPHSTPSPSRPIWRRPGCRNRHGVRHVW